MFSLMGDMGESGWLMLEYLFFACSRFLLYGVYLAPVGRIIGVGHEGDVDRECGHGAFAEGHWR
jgi:hypothetical protein